MPEVTVSRAGAPLIFFLVGLSLRLTELTGAALNLRLNLLTQTFSLGLLPAVGWLLSRGLGAVGLHPSLADGVMVLMALPCTINMCVILTQGAGGNVAASAFNAVLGNLLGVVVTPAILLTLLAGGVSGRATPPVGQALRKLSSKVVLPLLAGQLVRRTPLGGVQARRKKAFSRLSECILLSIIYTTFCDNFSPAGGLTGAVGTAGRGGYLAMLVLMPALHLASLALMHLFSSAPALQLSWEDRIAALFCGSHKTLAFGLPLIKTLFEGSPDLGLLATPLLIYHPAELLLGSFLVPRLRREPEE